MSYVLVTNKIWHNNLFANLKNKHSDCVRIKTKEDFTIEKIKEINPSWIFIPHWSYIIPADIYNNYKCVVFHMTDLPYGRGGSPLQNLIERGHKETMLSAIQVEEGLDTGDVYLKTPLNLEGSAEEIFLRASKLMESMIEEIIKTNPLPKKQEGEVVVFKRRKPEQSNIANLKTIEEINDYIRMLDCEGYPKAFIEVGDFRFEFNKARLTDNKTILADVRIFKK
jgi:methionyl-tRNA formyltransferase